MQSVLVAAKKNLTDADYMTQTCYKMMRIFVIISVLLFVASESYVTYAAGSNMNMDSEINTMFGVFKGLANVFIKVAYGLMIIIFAIGMVKSGVSAQAAQQFGAANRVSGEIMNVMSGIVIFVFGILAYPLVEKIIANVVSSSAIESKMNTDSLKLPGIGN